jgi:hypothetical protein
MAGWPELADVRTELRLVSDPSEDQVIEWARKAAIDWGESVTNRRFHTIDEVTGDDVLDVPDGPWMACLLHASRIYRRRDSLDGTIGWGDQGVVRVGRIDSDIWAGYGPYIWNVFA